MGSRQLNEAERGDFHVLTHADGKVAWMLKRFAPFSVYARAITKNTQRMMGKTGAKP